ncbi:hypothetical protein BC1002_5491 [Paraburkholderia atlantica]|uniref:DUF4214 domain-containing protein n=1 Tax=Paraburkholderia atlantica TaxID=2654982 RepID=D5WG41_PARAM|nr:DUF4214 domain-containing protein [Paraburkholderia atlantica]ADG19417.1 hypothetical protein BC1002_5491 [Paraburkholderia atlantica]
MAAAQYYEEVQQAYLAYYGRPADPAGQEYWAMRLDNAGGNLSSIINEFGTSTESTALYGGSNMAAQITAIYQTLFGRAPDAEGLNFYQHGINSGEFTLASVALNIFYGATGDDKAQLDAKLAYADAFTNALSESVSAQIAYSGKTASDNARAAVAAVTDTASEGTAVENLDTTLANINAGAVGQTVTLTTGVDAVTLKGNNNVVNTVLTNNGNAITGTNPSTLTALDSIKGTGTGNTLNIVDASTGAATTLPGGISVSGVQTVNLQTVNGVGAALATPFDVSGFTGLTSFNVTTSTGADFVKAAGTTAVNVVDTLGKVSVVGGSTVAVTTDATSAVGITGAAGKTTAVTVNGGGSVTIIDANSATTVGAAGTTYAVHNAPATATANTIATVTVNGNSGAAVIDSDALTTLNLSNDFGGSVTINNTTAKQSLALNLSNVGYDATGAAAAETIASGATTLNVAVTGASDVVINDATATALNVSGSAALSLTGTLTNLKAVTVAGSAGLTADLSGDASLTDVNASATSGNNTLTLASGVTYEGGSGNDTVTLSAAPTVAVDGGAGSNTLALSAIGNLSSLTKASLANATNFQTLELTGAVGGSGATLDVSGLPTGMVNVVVDTHTDAAALTFSNVASGFSFTELDSQAKSSTITEKTDGSADVLNLTMGNAKSVALTDSITASSFETVHLVANADTSAGAVTHIVNVSDAAATSLTISGSAGVDLSGATFGALTSIDTTGVAAKESVTIASGETSTNGVTVNVGAVDFTFTGDADAKHTDTITAGDGVVSITGSAAGTTVVTAGNGAADMVTLSAATNNSVTLGNGAGDQVTVGDGNNSITVGNGGTAAAHDSITAGNGNNTIVAGSGVNDITVGSGLNTVTTGANAATTVTIAAGVNATTYTTLTDFSTKGETISFTGAAANALTLGSNITSSLDASTSTFKDFVNYAVENTAAHTVSWFTFGGNTYVVENESHGATGFTAGQDTVVKLSGTVDLSHATVGNGTLVHA